MKKHTNFIGAVLSVLIAVSVVLFIHHNIAKMLILTVSLFLLCYFAGTIQVLKEEERLKKRALQLAKNLKDK